ncbi:MAG: methyltransferase domain-containing protein [Gemmatimonadetes bacterium]|nr:methyltransferase domain-containing protein [Gemmatimonadota bacterium]
MTTTALTSPIGNEVLDGSSCPPALARATLRDIARSNTLFGGRAAVWFGVRELLKADGRRVGGSEGQTAGWSHGQMVNSDATIRQSGHLTILDIGAGGGDIAAYVARRARERGTMLTPIALDWHRAAAGLCRERGLRSIVADAWSLPLAPRSFDIVVVSQVLHHFRTDPAVGLLRELSGVARRGVVIADLRRSAAAAAGIWLAGWALRFHPVTRRDGVTSVRRGFSVRGLSELLLAAGMPTPVHRRPGYRVVAAWRAPHADG